MLPSFSRPGGALPRSHSTTNLHDLVSDLHRQREQYQTHMANKAKARKEKKFDASTISKKLSRQASFYYQLAKSKSLRGKRSASSSPKDAPNTTTTATTKTQQQKSLQQPDAQQPLDMPRIQRADSRVRVQQVLPILQPSSAEIEELSEQQQQLEEYEQQLHASSKVADDTHDVSPSFPSMLLETPANTMVPPDSPATPLDECIQRGIQYHENGDVDRATAEFKHAAEEGSPMGMFFYGLALRHGWGCEKNEKHAFRYLQKSAEHAIVNLEHFVADTTSAELVLALYELGVSFYHGWGCEKDQKAAVFFYKMAADLGDADAQNDLAQCYHHGIGVKKDMHLAAKYYRKAARQGRGVMGNSWIYKPKYDRRNSF
ncbi:hcp-like protein [Lichtheimia corymbifera JMRC:FSU:9682]|uniref:Hcp-like protein n=1 Tax=Lichtheimia corymbifera JMRC:FSU:9682 TaxID=1263082 RepID=A0A068RT21_9FUNG|nr:hcp-like protein [Lichtheimia corymbifera JMRC:FSU:9682]